MHIVRRLSCGFFRRRRPCPFTRNTDEKSGREDPFLHLLAAALLGGEKCVGRRRNLQKLRRCRLKRAWTTCFSARTNVRSCETRYASSGPFWERKSVLSVATAPGTPPSGVLPRQPPGVVPVAERPSLPWTRGRRDS